MQFNAVEAGQQRVACSKPIFQDDLRYLVGLKSTRLHKLLRPRSSEYRAGGFDGRRCNRRCAVRQEARMRDATRMHELQEDKAAFGVHCVGDRLPGLDLRLGMDARRAHVAFAKGLVEPQSFANERVDPHAWIE